MITYRSVLKVLLGSSPRIVTWLFSERQRHQWVRLSEVAVSRDSSLNLVSVFLDSLSGLDVNTYLNTRSPLSEKGLDQITRSHLYSESAF